MVQDHTLSSTDDISSDLASVVTTSWNIDSGNTPLQAVLSAVAKAKGSDPLELPPLYNTIDADALNQLFLSEPGSSAIRVSFHYEGCKVTIKGSGEVRVEPSLDA